MTKDASRSERGLRVVTTEPSHHDAGSSAVTYGLRALATVVFDIDSGQRLDALYPADADLSEDARKSIAHLSLPHSNKQDEGDTQFIVRFKETKDSAVYLYGFVLFRQQRDASRSRGYLQRAIVVVATKPFVDLYDRVLRVVGPLFFQVGNAVLEALYENIAHWPPLLTDTPLSLPLAGTYISCVVPDLLDYERIDERASSADAQSPSPTGHLLGDIDDGLDHDDDDDQEVEDDEEVGHGEEESGDDNDVDSNGFDGSVCVKEGRFIVTKQSQPPSPSFGDVLMSRRSSRSTPFESVGLYSTFMGFETCLWQMWQFAITGESLVILSPHARTCSQATLALTSLIAPLSFEGDYRPYYALYEADFDEIASRQGDGVSSPSRMTIIGTTNPFFMKSFKRWPNAMVFPFLETSEKSHSRNRPVAGISLDANADSDYVSVRIKPSADLETLEDSDRAMLFRRQPRYLDVDTSVLSQLITPPEVVVTQTASTEDEPYVAINNAILRRHFRKLTKRFLRPFDQYFGLWSSNSTNSNLYMSPEDVLKPFDLKNFLSSVNPRQLPPQIKRSKWRALYTAFVMSPHFQPWFAYRRKLCTFQFTQTLRALRASVTPEMLLTSPCGKKLTLAQCEALEQEITTTLNYEKEQLKTGATGANSDQIRVVEAHLQAVRARIRELLV